MVAACLWLGATPFTAAQMVTYDFDTGVPMLMLYRSLPSDQTAGGITARFSAISGGFSIQTDGSTGFILTQFSGKYLYPNTSRGSALRIEFSRELNSIVFTFATTEYPDDDRPTPITLTAFSATPSGTNVVGSATNRATYGNDTFPMGTLAFDSGSKTFNGVEVRIQPGDDATFLVDNVTVTTIPQLNIRLGNSNGVVVHWQWPSTGFVLQQTPALDSANWVNAANPVEVVDGQNQVTVWPTTGNGFYRLFHP
jgi:hypothetical protein